MANFAVTWDASAFGRLDTAEALTNWTNDGANPTVEPDYFYQGSNCISCQVKTAEVGEYCAPGSVDMSTTARVFICKLIQTNYGSIDGNGLTLRIGSGTGAYYPYVGVFTASTYPTAGGWQVLLIDPNVSQWRGTPTGSPNLAAVNYWAIRSDASATAKAPNLGMDAIDVMNVGTGLTGVGADTTGSFATFLAADEGTSGNRWGIILSLKGILYVNGVLTIGSSGTPADFDDSNVVLVFPDHRVTTGTVGIDFDLQNASTTIAIANCVFNGRGALYTSDDTRPDYTVTGTSGALTISGSTFNGFRQIDFTSVVDALACNFLNGLKINSGGCDLDGSTFEGCTGAADASYLHWNASTDPDGELDGCSFTKGSTATHAIQFDDTIPSSITLRNCSFSGYNASDSQNDSTLYFADSTGTITLNLVGCSGTISIKTAGCTVNKVIDPVTTTLTVKDVNTLAVVQNARVLAVAADATGDLPFELSVTSINRSGSTATVVTGSAHGMATDDIALISGANQDEYNGAFAITYISSTSFSYTVPGTPTTPATGTIIVTGGYFNELTNASGIVTDTRSITNDQPLTGVVRLGASPYYKPAPVSVTVDSVNGVTATIFLIPDD